MASLVNPVVDRLRQLFASGHEPVELVIVFGSMARGTDRPDSDVDVGVVFRGDIALRDELDLQKRLETVAGREVDLVRLDEADLLLRYRAARDGIVVYSDPPYAASRFLARAGWEHDEERELREDAMRRYATALARGA